MSFDEYSSELIRMRHLARALWILLVSFVAQAQSGNPLAHSVDEIVEPYLAARNFMGVVAIGKDGEKPVLRSYGQGNVEKSVQNDINGRFMIGSMSKQFTAAAILLLEEDGLSSTNDLVARHLPGFGHGSRITIEQLLAHTAGVADTYSLETFRATGGQSGSLSDILEELGAAPLTQAPGAGFSYSNGGYVVLAAIIERLSDDGYGDFLARRIFDPLGMSNTSHKPPAVAERYSTTGYHPSGTAGISPITPQSPEWLAGAGSLWSTAGDLLRWSEALHAGRLLTAESYEKMTGDYGSQYGYGLSVFSRFGKRVFGHDGRVSGYASDIARYVDDDVTVVVLSNVESVARDEIRVDVAAAYFGEDLQPRERHLFSSQDANPTSLTGIYRFGPGFRVTAHAEDGRLLVRANEGVDSELVHKDGSRWFSRMLYVDVCFGESETGAIDRLIWGCGENAPVGFRED